MAHVYNIGLGYMYETDSFFSITVEKKLEPGKVFVSKIKVRSGVTTFEFYEEPNTPVALDLQSAEGRFLFVSALEDALMCLDDEIRKKGDEAAKKVKDQHVGPVRAWRALNMALGFLGFLIILGIVMGFMGVKEDILNTEEFIHFTTGFGWFINISLLTSVLCATYVTAKASFEYKETLALAEVERDKSTKVLRDLYNALVNLPTNLKT